MKTKIFYLGDDEMKIVESYKYLGLILDTNFSFKAHLEKVTDKARKRMNALCTMGLSKEISAKAILRGWGVLVRPIMEYGAEIWGEKKWKEGEGLQNEMGRRVLGVSRLTTKEVIQGELGLQSVKSRRSFLRIKFWIKILKTDENRLVYKIYKQRRKIL